MPSYPTIVSQLSCSSESAASHSAGFRGEGVKASNPTHSTWSFDVLRQNAGIGSRVVDPKPDDDLNCDPSAASLLGNKANNLNYSYLTQPELGRDRLHNVGLHDRRQ